MPKRKGEVQARHASVLADTPSQRLGSFPNLGILFPSWRPCRIRVFSQKLTPARRFGVGAPSREVPSQNCAFCAPKQNFFAQNGP